MLYVLGKSILAHCRQSSSYCSTYHSLTSVAFMRAVVRILEAIFVLILSTVFSDTIGRVCLENIWVCVCILFSHFKRSLEEDSRSRTSRSTRREEFDSFEREIPTVVETFLIQVLIT